MVPAMSVGSSTRVIVGRDEAMADLRGAFAEAQRSAVMVLISGEAGVGKTRLVAEFSEEICRSGHTVLSGGSIELAGEPIPYAPIAEMMRAAARTRAAIEADVWPGGGSLPAPAGAVSHGGRGELFERILTLFDRLVPISGSVLLIVEDVHWADESTLDLLAFLARNLPPGCLLLITCRTDEADRRPGLRSMLSGLTRSARCRRLQVVPLSRAEIGRLVASVRGAPPAAAELDAIFARSQGNPFIAEELMTAEERGGVPVSVRDLLLARTRGFSAAAWEVTWLAATLGHRVHHDVLAAAAATTMTDTQFAAAVGEAAGSGLLTVDVAREEYAFRHVLSQETVLQELLPAQRRRLHAAAAGALQAGDGSLPAAGVAAECARHWYLAGEQEAALDAGIGAARLSADVFAYDEAWRQYRRALAIDEKLRHAGAQLPISRRVLLTEASQAARWAGAASAGAELAESAAALAESDGDRALLAERRGHCLWDAGRTDEARIAFEQADHLLRGGEPSIVAAGVAASLAHIRLMSGDHGAALPLARRAIVVAQSAGAEDAEGRARITLGMSMAFAGRLDEGTEQVRRGHDLVSRRGDLDDRRRADGNLCYALLMAGRTAEACEVALSGLALIRRYGLDASAGAALTANTVVLLRLTGRWEEAEKLSEEALAKGVAEGQARYLHLALGELAIGRGDLAAARTHLDRAWQLSTQPSPTLVADLQLAESELALEGGAFAAAQQRIRQLLAAVPASATPRLMLQVCWLALRIEAECVLRERWTGKGLAADDAITADALLERARAEHRQSPSPENEALAKSAQAEHGRIVAPNNPQRWHSAAEAWQALSRPREHAYCCLRWAEAELETARSTQPAAPPLRACHRLATGLGATRLAAEAAALARRARICLDDPAPVPAPRTVASELGLTAREIEVLQGLVRGGSNRDIGEQLFLSHRTVGVHVSNVLAKLGVSNRGQAAAAALKLNLIDEPRKEDHNVGDSGERHDDRGSNRAAR